MRYAFLLQAKLRQIITNNIISDNPYNRLYPPADRVQLLADLLNLVISEKLPVNFPLQFLSYLKEEREFGPWKIAAEYLTALLNDRMTSAEKYAAKVKLQPIFKYEGDKYCD